MLELKSDSQTFWHKGPLHGRKYFHGSGDGTDCLMMIPVHYTYFVLYFHYYITLDAHGKLAA